MKTTAKRVWLALGTALLVIAMVAVSGLTGIGGRTVRAAQGTITITPPSGTEANQTHTYYIFKVFDAVGDGGNISYKLLPGKAVTDSDWTGSGMDNYFDVDSAGNVTAKDTAKDNSGNLSQEAITAIDLYYQRGRLPQVGTVTTTGTAPNRSDNLDNGYYYITTTTGSVVTITSTNPSASVTDKNTVPTVTKIISDTGSTGSKTDDGEKAIAQAGNTITYTATVTFGKGASNVKFHDKMGTNLAAIENEEVTVTIKDSADTTANDITSRYPATISKGADADAGDSLTINFADGIPEGAVATITYKAKVVGSDMTTDETAAQNTAWVTYGSSSAKTPEEHTKVYTAKVIVTKHDGNGAALAGAGFVLKSNTGAYYKKNNDNNTVSWVSNEDDATEYTSNAQGNGIVFDGLPNGTFTLVEKTVPAGYNKAADQSITINAATADDAFAAANLVKNVTVVNNAGSALPSAGGMGTLIFTIVGAAIVAGAVTLIVKRRKDQQKDA